MSLLYKARPHLLDDKESWTHQSVYLARKSPNDRGFESGKTYYSDLVEATTLLQVPDQSNTDTPHDDIFHMAALLKQAVSTVLLQHTLSLLFIHPQHGHKYIMITSN
ncbi:unnamed protein product [Protopolystoma xenopodis]|uniref:Uncharacterized protein n=1 Tax=Protopolystoma xenopodis TaxID=117903 RepID=A0A448WRI7_9PLAT|nr:unnamed protein product [Protopolystoma xenopodis]